MWSQIQYKPKEQCCCFARVMNLPKVFMHKNIIRLCNTLMVGVPGPVRRVNVPFLAGDSLTSFADHSSVVFSIFLVAV